MKQKVDSTDEEVTCPIDKNIDSSD